MLLQTNSMAFREPFTRWPLTLGRFVEFPRAIPQTSLGLRGHLISNLPQAMLLLINNAFLPTPAK